jgi:hypothetical protein
MEAGFSLAELVLSSRYVVQFLVGIIAGFWLFSRLYTYIKFKFARIERTTELVEDFMTTKLATIHNRSVENASGIMHGYAGGVMTQEDRLELLAYFCAAETVLTVRLPRKLSIYIKKNGYYCLYKKAQSGCLKCNTLYESHITERSEELRAISQAFVSNVFRPNSPLVGLTEKRFSYADGKTVYREIIERHVQEVDREVEDIRELGYSLFPVVYKLFEYKHKD